MISTSFRPSLLALAALVVTSTATLADSHKVLSIVTSNDPEAQAMALILANEAKAAGNDVSVLLCGPAGDAALRQAPEAATKVVTPKGLSVQKLLAGFLQKGGKAEVCAIYLPNRKLDKEALIEGVGVAAPPAVAAQMADPAVKVVGN